MRNIILSLVFAITAIVVQAQEPVITMTTTKSINSQFSFGIRATANSTPIQVDWGNGVKENFTIGEETEFFGFPLKGSSVKVWGEGIASLNVAPMELTALDVTRATSLTYLYIKANQLATLDLSNCTALTYVNCSENLLTSLYLPSTSTLDALNCDNNLLTSLDVSGATGITELICTNNKLTFASLPVKQPTWTTYTYSPQQSITLPKQIYSPNEEIDLSSQLTVGSNTTTYTWKTASGTVLVNGTDYNATEGKFTFPKTYTESFFCEMTNATFPDLTLKTWNISVLPTPSVVMTTTTAVGNTFSFDIRAIAYETPIQVDWGNGSLVNYTIGYGYSSVSGTLTGNTIKIYGVGIDGLELSNNQLTALDVSNNTALTYLNCRQNQLTALDVTNNTALTNLDCDLNQLTALDVSNNTALTNLDCDFNQLTALDVFNNTALTKLNCFGNQLTSLDVTNNTVLTNLECSSNHQLTALDVSNNTALTSLYCSSNQLTALDVSNNIALVDLYCYSNQLTALDVSNSAQLEWLDCSSNQLTTVDVTNNTALTHLDCSYNQLTTVDVTNNTALTYLNCRQNQLTALDVTNNPALEKLECDYNQLTFSTLPIQHPSWTDYTYSPQGKLSLSKNELAINEEIDLGSHLTAGGNTTTYVWKTKGGVMLIKDVDYTESNGKFTFLKQPGDYFYCEMRNTTFPELTLATENIFITTGTDEPSITMTTTTAVGSTFSFDISTTTYNTPIKVDWGNGSLFSYTIGGRSTVSGKLAGNTIKIYGVGISCLYLQGKKLTALDVTNTIALTELICFNNQLTALDVTNNTALTELLCSDNLLTALDVTSNTALKLLSCFNNQLTFSALPVPNASWTTYRYSPQEKVFLAKTDYELNEEIDLSSQLAAEGNTTTYVWKTLGGVTLIKDVDYTESNGKFTFIKQPGDYFYFEMSNATFPKLTLTTDNIFIIPDQPSIIMTTAATYYSNFTITLKTKARNVPIKIDWGNGILINEMVYNSYSTSTSLVGNTIKIYGLGIEFLSMPNKKLTSLDVSNNTELAELDCHFNHLTSLDVSNNAALTKLNCSDNYLTFSTLPVRKPTWTSYSYSPQSAVKLPKKQYALTEAVDLSSELDVNGNTTNYTWKTKGGATLVAGIDYNVVGGVTTFLRVQTDSVYCQMTNATFPELTLNTINIKVSAYPLSVEDNEVAISVYPNPATENFTIKMTEEIVRVEVYSITGVRVFENGQYSSPTVTVPLTNMPKGALLIKAYTRNGVYSSKVVKI